MRLFARAPAKSPTPRANGALGAITFPQDAALAVSREAALSLSVIANAHALIVGVASQLRVERTRGEEELPAGTILTQPDPDETWPTTIGWTLDDLIWYGTSYWLVIRRDVDGFPSRARRLPWSAVATTLDPDYSKFTRIQEYAVGGVPVQPRDIIRFTMPGLGVLRDSAAVLLDALTLGAAASRHATIPLPAGVLTNTGQEVGGSDAKQIVAEFDAARLRGETAFLQSMTYERTAFSAADLMLIDALAAMDARLARVMNVPVALVSASPTGGASAQVYANIVSSFAALIQQAVAPYLRGIEETFTSQDVTPRGQTVTFDTEDWLRFTSAAIGTPTTLPQATQGGLPA